MSKRPSIEIFKTKLGWELDPYHPSKTDSVYVIKLSDDSELPHITDDISTMPEKLSSFYSCGRKVYHLDSVRRNTVASISGTEIDVINEPLSHEEISDLVTACANEAYSYPHFHSTKRKAAQVEIIKAKAKIYYRGLDQERETTPVYYMLRNCETGSYVAHDKVFNVPHRIMYYFAPGTRITVPKLGKVGEIVEHTQLDYSTTLQVIHGPLTNDDISELLRGFAYQLNRRKKEFDEVCRFRLNSKIHFNTIPTGQ